MSPPRRWFFTFLTGCSLAVAAAAWSVFAPIPLGGQAAYVIVNGNSMEPLFHTGDLVIVSRALDYQVGDLITYQDPVLRRYVFHRIVGTYLDRYVLKGDHNSWTDSYRPTASEVIGKFWIYLPQVGKTVEFVRSPIILSLITGALAGFIMLVMLESNNKKARKKQAGSSWFSSLKNRFTRLFAEGIQKDSDLKKIVPDPVSVIVPRGEGNNRSILPAPEPKTGESGRMIEGLLFFLGLLSLASLALSIFAFTRPLSQSVPNIIHYQQTGKFSYSAHAPATVYDFGTIISGEPVFLALNCIVSLQFQYSLVGDGVQGLTGTHQLTAQIVDEMSGWQRSIPLEGMTAFAANTFTTTSTLNWCQMEDVTALMEARTNLHPPTYSLFIDPHVNISGKISGLNLQDTFQPLLVFQFNKTLAYLIRNDPLVDPLSPTKPGVVQSSITKPNTFPLFGLMPEVSTVRALGLFGFVLSLAGLISLGLYISKTARNNQQSYARMKYGSQFVDVRTGTLGPAFPIIEAVTIDDLARLAEQQSSPILHAREGAFDTYYVQGDRVTYRYTPFDGAGAGPGTTASQQLVLNLRQGIDLAEFQVYYQPIVSLVDGRISTVEALLRWQHPQKGLISAGEFILAAEEAGLMNTIGNWMLQVAISQLKEWRDAGLEVKLAVNLSERQLGADTADLIIRLLQNAGLDPRFLQIEIQESRIAKDTAGVVSSLQKLRNLGVQISVDHFTGQLPLAALGHLPINGVKVDREFMDMIEIPERASLVSNLLSEASDLGLEVTAGGVETDKQLDFLRQNLYKQAQGYLLGRPAPAGEVKRLLQDDHRTTTPKSRKAPRKTREKTQ